MRFLFLLAFIAKFNFVAYSQAEPEYFDQKFRLLPGKDGAAYYTTTQFTDNKKESKIEITYLITGEKHAETKFNKTPDGLFLPEGLAQKWYKNGQLYYTTHYRQGKKEGQAVGHYASGKLKRRENFVNGELQHGECFSEDGTPVSFYPHEVVPKFPGGPNQLLKFLMKNLRYPAAAQRYGDQGVVIVRAIFDETGKLVSSEVVNSVYSSLDKEALRVVRIMPDFEPAMEEGMARASVHFLPFRFGKGP